MSKEELQQAIKEARPPLSVVAPLTNAICRGYVAVNIAIGLGMILLYAPTTDIVIVNNLFTFDFWGAVFIILGLTQWWGLHKNDWQFSKFSLLLGLAVKSCWFVALAVRVLENPSAIVITLVWLFFAYVQAMTYIHFLPIPKGQNNDPIGN